MFDKLKSLIKSNELIIIENPLTLRYLTQEVLDLGFLLITHNKNLLLVDNRYFSGIKPNHDFDTINLENFKSQLNQFISDYHINKIYLETNFVTMAHFKYYQNILPQIEFDLSSVLNDTIMGMRSIKFTHEINKIKTAQKMTDEAFSYIINYIGVGQTELNIKQILEKKLISLGSDGPAFDFIIASGKNSALPHARPSSRKFQKGDFITIDFGAKVDGYSSDMTRTVALGPLSSFQQDIYQLVLEAQSLAINSIRPGVLGKNLEKIVRDHFSKLGYEKYFTHSLGHGVGLEIHENPRLSSFSNDIMLKGSVITIEPGLYFTNEFGVRIEDMILVDDWPINLTQSNKNLICL